MNVNTELAGLQNAAANTPVATVRYESLSYTGLEPWLGPNDFASADNTSIARYGSPDEGIFVYPVADDANYQAVVYACCEGQHCIFPVAVAAG